MLMFRFIVDLLVLVEQVQILQIKKKPHIICLIWCISAESDRCGMKESVCLTGKVQQSIRSPPSASNTPVYKCPHTNINQPKLLTAAVTAFSYLALLAVQLANRLADQHANFNRPPFLCNAIHRHLDISTFVFCIL